MSSQKVIFLEMASLFSGAILLVFLLSIGVFLGFQFELVNEENLLTALSFSGNSSLWLLVFTLPFGLPLIYLLGLIPNLFHGYIDRYVIIYAEKKAIKEIERDWKKFKDTAFTEAIRKHFNSIGMYSDITFPKEDEVWHENFNVNKFKKIIWSYLYYREKTDSFQWEFYLAFILKNALILFPLLPLSVFLFGFPLYPFFGLTTRGFLVFWGLFTIYCVLQEVVNIKIHHGIEKRLITRTFRQYCYCVRDEMLESNSKKSIND